MSFLGRTGILLGRNAVSFGYGARGQQIYADVACLYLSLLVGEPNVVLAMSGECDVALAMVAEADVALALADACETGEFTHEFTAEFDLFVSICGISLSMVPDATGAVTLSMVAEPNATITMPEEC